MPSEDPRVASHVLSFKTSRGHGGDGPADPEPPVESGPDSDRAGSGVLALVKEKRFVIGTALVSYQVSGGRTAALPVATSSTRPALSQVRPSGRSGSST